MRLITCVHALGVSPPVALPCPLAGQAKQAGWLAGWQVTRGTDAATLTCKTGLYSTMQAQGTNSGYYAYLAELGYSQYLEKTCSQPCRACAANVID